MRINFCHFKLFNMNAFYVGTNDGQKAWVEAPHENYTKGISVHQADISGKIFNHLLWLF